MNGMRGARHEREAKKDTEKRHRSWQGKRERETTTESEREREREEREERERERERERDMNSGFREQYREYKEYSDYLPGGHGAIQGEVQEVWRV
jgi:hypothetical protein